MTSEKTSRGYLKGNARHWFWPVGAVLVWMLIWSTISPAVYSSLLGRMGLTNNSNVIMIAAGIQTFLHTAAWVMIGLSYGLTNKVKAFGIMFFVVAGIQIVGAYSHFLSNFAVSHILRTRGTLNPAVMTYTEIMSLLLNGAWIVFALIAICRKRTGGGLRTASIVLLAVRIIMLIYRYGNEEFIRRMLENMQRNTALTLIGLTGLGMNILAYGALIFFFGAMAFSRMKETRIHAI